MLVPGDGSHASGSAAAAALVAARRFSVGRSVVLLDLDPFGGHLRKLAGPQDGEGLSEALEFGISLQAAGFSLQPGIRFVPPGRLLRGGLSALFEHPGWRRILGAAARRNTRLLAYIPADENLPLLAPLAGGALLLATPGEELNLRARLPRSLQVLGTFEPPSHPPGSRASELDEGHEPTVLIQASSEAGRDRSTDRTERSDEEPVAPGPPWGAEAADDPQPSSANTDSESSFASVLRAVTTAFDRRQIGPGDQSRTGSVLPTSPATPASRSEETDTEPS